MYRGEVSASLAYNANAAAMKVAFEAMKTVQTKSITVTFSGPATAAFTGTFVHPETRGLGELVQIVGGSGLLTVAPAPVDVVTTLTTAGTTGLATGNYDVYLWFWMFKDVKAAGGRLSSSLL